MDLDTVATFIQTVGFPIAVASFVLFRMNGKLAKLEQAVRENTAAAHETAENTSSALRDNTAATRDVADALRALVPNRATRRAR